MRRIAIAVCILVFFGLSPLAHAQTWWDSEYQYRRHITITNNNLNKSLPSGYTVNITLNTTGPNFLPGGDDVRIVFNSKELDRINTTQFNSPRTELSFMTQQNISPGGSDSNYWAYYGNPNASSPPENTNKVYQYFQNFNGLNMGDLNGQDSWWGSQNFDVVSIASFEGYKSVRVVDGSDYTIIRNVLQEHDYEFVAHIRKDAPAKVGGIPIIILQGSAGDIVQLRLEVTANGYVGYKDSTGYVGYVQFVPQIWYKYSVRVNQNGKFNITVTRMDNGQVVVDDKNRNVITNNPLSDIKLLWNDQSGGGTGFWDTFRYRKFLYREPTTDMGSEEMFVPFTLIIHSPQNITYSTAMLDLNVTANVTSNATIDSWWYSLNNGQNVGFVPNVTIAASEGFNFLEVFANDTQGAAASTTIGFTVDSISPVLNNPVPPANGFIATPLAAVFSIMLNESAPSGTSVAVQYRRQGVGSFQDQPLSCSGGPPAFTCSGTVDLVTAVAAGEEDVIEFFFNATDAAGNAGQFGSGAFPLKAEVDTIAPQITVLSPPKQSTLANSEVNFNVSVAERNPGTGYVVIDNVSYQLVNNSGNWGFVHQNMSDGSHTVSFSLVDAAGNMNTTPTYAFSVDTTPPAVVIASPVNAFYAAENITLMTSADEAVISWWYTLNDGGNVSFVPGSNISLLDGSYVLQVFANDSVGNVGSASAAFTVDTTFPQVTVISPLQGFYATQQVVFNISVLEVNPSNGTVTIDENVSALVNSSGNWAPASRNLSEGAHTAFFTVSDKAGNVVVTQNISFTVDTIPPAFAILSPSNTTFPSAIVWFNISLDEAHPDSADVEFEGFNYSLANSSGIWSLAVPAVSDGQYSASFFVNDSAGNFLSKGITFTIDTTPPVLNETAPSNNDMLNNPASLLFQVSLTEQNPLNTNVFYRRAGIGNYRQAGLNCSGSAPGMICATVVDASSILGNGDVMEFYFSTVDNAGNTGGNGSAAAPLTAIIDLNPPALAVLSPQGKNVSSSSINFNVSVNEPYPDWGYVEVDGINYTLTNNSGIWEYNNSSMPDNTYTAMFMVSDLAGNVGSVTVTFTVDTLPPAILMHSPTSMIYNTTGITVNVSGSEPIDSFWYSLNGGPTVFFAPPANVTGQENQNVLEVWGNDSAGNVGSALVNFTVDTTPPIMLQGNATILEDSGMNDNVLYLPDFGFDNVTASTQLSYNMVSAGNTSMVNCMINMNNSLDCVTQKDQFGVNPVTVKVTDSVNLSAVGTLTITVQNVNDPPQLSGLPDHVLLEDSGLNDNLVDLSLFASDIDNSITELSFSLIYQSNPGVVSCSVDASNQLDCTTQQNQNGFSVIVAEVSDGQLTDTDVFIVVVLPVNDPPIITSTPVTSATLGERYVYNAEAVDVDGDNLTWSLLQWPQGMNVDPATGIVSWVPGKTGTFNVSLRVSDGQAGAVQNYTINVHCPPGGDSLSGPGWIAGTACTENREVR